jgi:hypothetical protein
MAVNVDEKADEISLGSPRTLFHLVNTVPVSQSLGVTPDGQRFLVLTTNQPSSPVPLTLVTAWNAELKTK